MTVSISSDSQRVTDLVTDSLNDKAVCRSAPATPGLIISKIHLYKYIYNKVGEIVRTETKYIEKTYIINFI